TPLCPILNSGVKALSEVRRLEVHTRTNSQTFCVNARSLFVGSPARGRLRAMSRTAARQQLGDIRRDPPRPRRLVPKKKRTRPYMTAGPLPMLVMAFTPWLRRARQEAEPFPCRSTHRTVRSQRESAPLQSLKRVLSWHLPFVMTNGISIRTG